MQISHSMFGYLTLTWFTSWGTWLRAAPSGTWVDWAKASKLAVDHKP